MYNLEFLGPPGAGKSTVALRLVSTLRRLGAPVVVASVRDPEIVDRRPGWLRAKAEKAARRARRVWDTACGRNPDPPPRLSDLSAFIAAHPAYTRFVISRIAQQSFDEWAWKRLDLMLVLFMRYQALERRDSGTHLNLWDEAFIQRAFTTLASAETSAWSREEFAEYISLAPLPNVLVYMQASPELCISRMAARPSGFPGRLRSLGKGDRYRMLEAWNEAMEFMTDSLESRGCIVVRIDARQAAEMSVRQFQAAALTRGLAMMPRIGGASAVEPGLA